MSRLIGPDYVYRVEELESLGPYQLGGPCPVGDAYQTYSKNEPSHTATGALKDRELCTFVSSRTPGFWRWAFLGSPRTISKGKPRIPRNLYESSGDGRIAIFWDKNTESDLVGYEVFRRLENHEFSLIARIPEIARIDERDSTKHTPKGFTEILLPTLYVDSNVRNGQRYEYKVRAVDSDGDCSDFAGPIISMPKPHSSPSGDEIILLVNRNTEDSNKNGSNDSLEVAMYYAQKRHVPLKNIVEIDVNTDIYKFNYAKDLQGPLKKYLLEEGTAGTIRYIVPCYGMPLRAGGRALDSKLADLFDRYTWGRVIGTRNPYFEAGRRFDNTYGTYLVTRVDGPSVEIAKSLVDNAIYAERNVSARSGTAYFGNYGQKGSIGDKAIKKCISTAKNLGIDTVTRDPGRFKKHELGNHAYWYFAWYHHYEDPVKGNWPPGSVGAHLISYSFKTIREKDPKKVKSWVQGLLEKGITATFGSVVEPYLQGFTRPDIFFERFWSGEYNFAESFYMATPTVQWAMSAVGDPLFRLKQEL